VKYLPQIICVVSLSIFSVAEAKKATRKVASEAQQGVFCGVLARGSSGHDEVDDYTLVDQPGNSSGSYFNAYIPLDAEIGLTLAPKAGDSNPNGPDYKSHEIKVGGQNVHFEYAGDFFKNTELAGSCICISGARSVIDGRSVLQTIDGYAIRTGHCSDISGEVVGRFTKHQE